MGRFGGLQRGGGSRTCDCVGKGKHSGANVRSRAPLSPSRHFGKPCPGATPGPRRTGKGNCCLTGTEFQFCKMTRVLWLDHGDGNPTK